MYSVDISAMINLKSCISQCFSYIATRKMYFYCIDLAFFKFPYIIMHNSERHQEAALKDQTMKG